MATTMKISVIAVFLAALAAAVGCEDSPLTTGSDFKMTILAAPTTVSIAPGATTPVTSTIIANIVNADGVPQQGLSVYFTSDGGTLASNPTSGPVAVKTDAEGNARDTLSVLPGDIAQISITAVSATLTQTVKVNKSVIGQNRPPVSTIVASPVSEQKILNAVNFDGSGSTDPDTGDQVTTYSWSITSSAPDPDWGTNPRIVPGSTVVFSNGFQHAQTLTVALTVTDSHGTSAVSSITYQIKTAICGDNPAPTADFGFSNPPAGHVGDTRTVDLGDLSSDVAPGNTTGVIARWSWDCGNGTASTAQNPTCTYTLPAATTTMQVKLIVWDNGLGGTGSTFECQKTATVTKPVALTVTSP